jgi:hypothetical protein
MPFSPERRREYDRQRRARAAELKTPPAGVNPQPDGTVPTVPLATAADALAVLREQVNLVRAGGSQQTGRTIAYLIATALRAIELATIEARLDAVERALKQRSEGQ